MRNRQITPFCWLVLLSGVYKNLPDAENLHEALPGQKHAGLQNLIQYMSKSVPLDICLICMLEFFNGKLRRLLKLNIKLLQPSQVPLPTHRRFKRSS